MEMLKSLKEIDNKNYILKIGANWCNPCKLEDNILNKDSIVKLLKEKNVSLYKIDADDSNFDDLLDQYSVASIPVILYFKDNEMVLKTVNLQLEQQILDNISRIY